MPNYSPHTRVIVRLPFNRPEQDIQDPPPIEWNAEKENILWEVIARSRASDSGGTDWQGLSAHLQIPLPYLLYRAQRRYEQDLQGLQDLQGALSPTNAQSPTRPSEDGTLRAKDRPEMLRVLSGRNGGSATKLSSSLRLTTTSLGIRARLNSLGYDSPIRQSKASSSSTLTLQGPKSSSQQQKTPPSSDSESEEEADKAEEEERRLEEEETLNRKLKDLQKVMTSETLGLVREPRRQSKGKEVERGRHGPTSPKSPLRQSVRRSLSTSESASGTTSPQGSIPSIPSPSGSQPHSPISRHLSPAKKSSSPPALSSGNARGQSHMQYRPIMGRTRPSEKGSNHGSSASSFSDISETSVSASALESALLSNIRGGGSRL
ncbi:hypothetical protein BD410DRAFT_892664 [Rickenella mellea]|uniref:Autophagy-related protein 29 n=1 Tax=Rickenella mellea TaxID=50990 RepID=A0A4R5XGP0_9AGAM|nr:hypothetical protein BD410DRAFT_892664 [Rickenella mellea]